MEKFEEIQSREANPEEVEVHDQITLGKEGLAEETSPTSGAQSAIAGDSE